MNDFFLKTIFVFFKIFFFPSLIFTQPGTIELGGFAGFTQYQGDLAESHIEFSETLISKGLLFRVHVNEYFTIKTGYYNGSISGDDKNAQSEKLRNRNWRFNSTIKELAILGEWNILGIRRLKTWRTFKPNFTPILFAGIATTKANTSLVVPETDAHLFPEPGNKDSFFVIPFGAGCRFDFSKYATLGGEIGWRATFSDYIDNVSNNGDGANKSDWYSFAGINISILFGQWFFD